MWMILVALACSDPPPPASPDGCAAIEEPTAREDCRLERALGLLDDRPAFEAWIATLEPVSRDLLLIRLAVQQPQRARWLCEHVTTAEGQERCQRIVGRPHLGGGP